ncbi:two-component system, sporulation sensor kinase E [[Bacillus] enclensis]|uniref:histidine kinase n=2 Tax=[Bacillus] enclensis TaxID=1402860 RepID=A0A1C4CHZ2_9BACI|nr:two-component system, sporulation sensor kinase E [[Bacillus] enclensis]
MNLGESLNMRKAKEIALKVALAYVLLGILWVILSDYFSVILAHEKLSLYIYFQRFKGWFFIFVTGVILYLLVYRRTRDVLHSNEQLRKKERELYIQNEQYHSLFKHNPDGVLELDLKGKIMAVNPEAEALLESSQEELEDIQLRNFLKEEDIKVVTGHFIDTLSGKGSMFETNIHLAGEKAKILRCSFIPIIVSGEVTGVFAIARDITQFRKNEEMMIVSEKMSVIGQLAAAVAHEIRNPLTSLKGFIQLMQTTGSVNRDHLDIMLSEVDRIDLISGEMLILGKQQDLHYQIENVDSILKQVIVLMKAQANIDNVSIDHKPYSVEPLYVEAEANQLKQVFINIIKNAVEAIPYDRRGRVSISLNRKDNEAIIIVSDNGTGMDPERIEKVGEPFYSTKEKGTGLGLAICKKIIEKHKGKIVFHSEKQKGTVVEICLPLIQGNSLRETAERERKS